MLKSLLGRSSLVARIRGAWQHDANEAMKPIRKEIRRLSREVEALQAELRETSERAARGDRYASQLRLCHELDAQQRDQLTALPALLDESRIKAHVSHAIRTADMRTDPFEHIVVEEVLPPTVYDLLCAAIPPEVFFHDRDPIKLNIAFPVTFGPALGTHVWNFVDGVIAARMIQPAVIERFYEPLQHHYDTIFGPSFRAQANALPHLPGSGRLMLRRRVSPRPPSRSKAFAPHLPVVSGAAGRERSPRHAAVSCARRPRSVVQADVLSRGRRWAMRTSDGGSVPSEYDARVLELVRRARRDDPR